MKKYSVQEEHIARFAKAMAHPARVAILNFLVWQEICFSGIYTKCPHCKSNGIVAPQGTERSRGLIQGEIEAPKVRYCIHQGNWKIASRLMEFLFAGIVESKECCK